jgi:hypothetical protein
MYLIKKSLIVKSQKDIKENIMGSIITSAMQQVSVKVKKWN